MRSKGVEMKCHTVRELVFRRIDSELPEHESAEFDAHVAECESCAREYRLLSLPSRIARGIPAIEPSPYFYQKLKANLDGEAQNAAGWQIFLHLARQVIPALAGVTLALLSVFAYIQFAGNEPDLYREYNRVFISEDQPQHSFYEEGEITDEAVLSELGSRLAQVRLERNLTQAQLAEQAGVSKRTVERLESGSVATQLSGFIRVCRVLELLDLVGLPAEAASRYPHAFSGWCSDAQYTARLR